MIISRRAPLVAFLALIAAPAWADIPPAALDQAYQNCAAGGHDAQRNSYCACVRQGMSRWSEATWTQVMGQAQASGGNPANLQSGALTELAKQCIAKTLH